MASIRRVLRGHAGLNGARAGMWLLQQDPSTYGHQKCTANRAPAAGSAVAAGSPQAAHRQVRPAVSTLDCSQQAPRRFSRSGSARAMSREGEPLREQRGGGCVTGSTGSTVSPVSPSSRCRPARCSTWPRASSIVLRWRAHAPSAPLLTGRGRAGGCVKRAGGSHTSMMISVSMPPSAISSSCASSCRQPEELAD